MMQRMRALLVTLIVLAAGAFIGSAIAQWKPLPEADRRDAAAREALDPVARPVGRVRVEVLNAGGVPGMALRATELLREAGFDVVYFGNAEAFGQDSTVVLDRVGRLDAARAVADVLGATTVRSEPQANLYLDVTVRLGAAWEPAPRDSGTSEHDAPWWDVRRFFR
ncbi:MAG: LytR family transcriptional regulator [Gemmatimonadetes bacterium]|nr:MAG: LytR family transcriptional regulator [Gemmatimonadota bacterium]